uniref:4Fe-4S binding protein n=1 Tax=Acetatifactor sp. TaxID=1872090 RepID=UPI004057206F
THCPKGINIPYLIELYNEHIYSDGGFIAPMAMGAVPADKQPSACVGCRSCEQVCPQQIKISEMMKNFQEKLG